jgi:hypothetical protein
MQFMHKGLQLRVFKDSDANCRVMAEGRKPFFLLSADSGILPVLNRNGPSIILGGSTADKKCLIWFAAEVGPNSVVRRPRGGMLGWLRSKGFFAALTEAERRALQEDISTREAQRDELLVMLVDNVQDLRKEEAPLLLAATGKCKFLLTACADLPLLEPADIWHMKLRSWVQKTQASDSRDNRTKQCKRKVVRTSTESHTHSIAARMLMRREWKHNIMAMRRLF